MRVVIVGFALLLSSGVAAQSGSGRSEAKVKSDNGQVVTVTGCVMIGGATDFLLSNITAETPKRAADKNAGAYALVPREGLDLGQHIHQRVELTGVVVPAATRGDRDDKFEIRESGGRRPSKQTVKVARGATTQFLVATVKPLGPGCEQ